MESGALSDEAFPEFADKVVLFLHNTSRVEDEPYPKLLQEKGFGGFPSLAFMDAKGEVLAQPSGRSVKAFNETLDSLNAYLALKKKAEAGDKSVANALFVAELELGKLEFAEASARFTMLEGLADEQKMKIEAQLIGLEVASIFSAARKAGPEATNEKLVAMYKAGRIPTSGREEGQFWYTLLRYADKAEDAKIYEASFNGMKKVYGDNPRFARDAAKFEKRLAELKAQGN